MPEDGFIWNKQDADQREDTTFTLDLGTTGTDLRKMANSIMKEASLDPMSDARGATGEPDDLSSEMEIMPGDDFWL